MQRALVMSPGMLRHDISPCLIIIIIINVNPCLQLQQSSGLSTLLVQVYYAVSVEFLLWKLVSVCYCGMFCLLIPVLVCIGQLC